MEANEGASAVLLPDREGKNPSYGGVSDGLQDPRVDVRIFGKPIPRPFRRMAVALAHGQNALQRARAAAKKLSVHGE